MTNAAAALAQTIRVVIALVLAFVAAGFFLAFGLFQAWTGEAHPAEIGAAVGAGLVGASVIGGLSFVPALFAVFLSEALRLRGIVFHLAAGGVIALGLWAMQEAGDQASHRGLPPGSLVVLAAGFVGGFVYWLLAGRQAGCWRTPGTPPRDVRDDLAD
ncbi:hypothetical protein [Stappia stellulata]|uniref:hypothetical protein n=1 Tax=Stappia stellulata TaxID=71235 RepID=UPI000426801C|nr:hypothetical protein [Stappia stellulata]